MKCIGLMKEKVPTRPQKSIESGILGLMYYFWPAPEGYFILDLPNKHPCFFSEIRPKGL